MVSGYLAGSILGGSEDSSLVSSRLGSPMSVRNILSTLVFAFFGVSGCAEPFEVRRQELSGFRIAAVGVVDGKASAAIWSGEGLGHAEAPILEWSMDG